MLRVAILCDKGVRHFGRMIGAAVPAAGSRNVAVRLFAIAGNRIAASIEQEIWKEVRLAAPEDLIQFGDLDVAVVTAEPLVQADVIDLGDVVTLLGFGPAVADHYKMKQGES